MVEDLRSQFAGLQRYASALRGLIAGLQEHAPARSQGTDSTGAVQAVLDPTGLPISFRVEPDWDRRISPGHFSAAVVEAFQAAVRDRLSTWTVALEQAGWKQRAKQLTDGTVATTDQTGIPPAFRKPMGETTPRPLDTLAELVIKALDTAGADAAKAANPASGTGTDRSRRLTLVLSGTGLTSCNADSRWVARQSATRLTTALSQALTAAKREVARNSDRTAPATDLNQALAEAMALLQTPTRFTG